MPLCVCVCVRSSQSTAKSYQNSVTQCSPHSVQLIVEPPTKFSKRGRGPDRISIFRGVLPGKKLKSEIFIDKKKFINKDVFLSQLRI